MNALTVLLYLFGHGGAIRRIASSPMAVPVSILLVFSAGVARNYDQMWFGDSLWWLAGPLVFSLFSGAWIFLFVGRAWMGPHPQGVLWRRPSVRALVSFYGLFWMTAPIAWLYAIPVDRWYEPVEAAHWNVRLLATVSVWRVLLMSRVVSVIGEMPFLRAFGKVLLPASIEVLVISFFTGLGPRIMAGMAGLRHSPAEQVLLRALSTAIIVAFFAAVPAIIIQFLYRGRPARTVPWRSETPENFRRFPYLFLTLVAVLCWWISINPQTEQRLTREAVQLYRNKDWAGLIAFLSAHPREEFAPSIPLPPTAWSWEGVDTLPRVIEHLTPQTPAWVRELYVGNLDAVLAQEHLGYPFEHDQLL
jgi:hypothetical protein